MTDPNRVSTKSGCGSLSSLVYNNIMEQHLIM